MGVVVGDVGPFAVGGLDLIPSIGSDVDDFEEGAVLDGATLAYWVPGPERRLRT